MTIEDDTGWVEADSLYQRVYKRDFGTGVRAYIFQTPGGSWVWQLQTTPDETGFSMVLDNGRNAFLEAAQIATLQSYYVYREPIIRPTSKRGTQAQLKIQEYRRPK